MIGHNLPEYTSTYVLTESLEHIRISAHTLEFLLCDIKHVLHTFIFAVALNSLSDSSCSLFIGPIFLLSQYSFLSLHALCSVAPSWKDCLSLISSFDVFEKTFQCGVTQNSKEMEQLINLYQKSKKIQRHWCTAIFLSSYLISSTLRLFLVLKAHVMECYSMCPDTLQIMWISDHIEKTLLFWSE